MSVLIVEKENLKHNIRQIKEYAKENGNPQIIAIVKSNGYGLGLKEYSEFLIKNGINFLAVANCEEAIKLRKFGIKEQILMMSSTALKDEIKEMVENNITITIGSKEAKQNLIEIVKELKIKPKVHIKIDTGFGRYGYLYTDKETILNEIKELKEYVDIDGIFSHFSTSFYKEKWTNLQFERFKDILDYLEQNNINIKMKHISNSSAFIRFPQMNLNTVRIGSAFLGRIAVGNKLGLRKIGYLESEISEIKTLPKGFNIGYSNTYTTKKETKVALVETGYAEGFHMKLEKDMLSFSNKIRYAIQDIKKIFKNTKLFVEINNKKYYILGRIGMYHVTIDITNEEFKIGQKVKMNANPLYVDSSVRRVYR